MVKFLSIDPPPLRLEEDGTIRVGDTRVTFDTVILSYLRGETPADIVDAYDVLTLADVHAAIAYYHRNQDEVRAYLQRRGEEARQLRALIEARQGPQPTREEMLERRRRRESGGAETAQ
jgi:uncharacterized protein (DUF433 family)